MDALHDARVTEWVSEWADGHAVDHHVHVRHVTRSWPRVKQQSVDCMITYVNDDWFKRVRVQVTHVLGVTSKLEPSVMHVAQLSNLPWTHTHTHTHPHLSGVILYSCQYVTKSSDVLLSLGLCIELWVFFDACGVSSCGFGAGLRPPLRSLEAELSVITQWRMMM